MGQSLVPRISNGKALSEAKLADERCGGIIRGGSILAHAAHLHYFISDVLNARGVPLSERQSRRCSRIENEHSCLILLRTRVLYLI